MNIDFHYGVIYVVTRLAGFDQAEAQTIAHACQYVDDSTVPGVLEFEGGQSYDRFASAHEMLDYKNTQNSRDKLVWAPFHFLPAGQGETLEEKSVCHPNSEIAQKMVKRAIEGRNAENGLHRLGVTLHVYVDTWAHQHFTGTISAHNVVTSLKSDDHHPDTLLGTLKSYVGAAEDAAESEVIDLISKLGHGAALHFPDLPWAKWEYVNGHGIPISRENLGIFLDAANMAHKAARGFRSGNVDYLEEDGLPEEAQTALRGQFESNRSENPEERLAVFKKAVGEGAIPGIHEQLPAYVAKGPDSWKHAATGITETDTDGDNKPKWSENFEQSDYRKFHDAVKEHRFVVMQEILPAHGVRLA